MALFTPRGLKIRMAQSYAFALMARLFPTYDAFRVLQLTEEVENLASLSTFIAGLTVFFLKLEAPMIVTIVGVTCFYFKMVHIFGLFGLPERLLLRVSHVYSVLSGYGVFLVGLLVFGFFAVGWKGVVAFAGAKLIASWVADLIDQALTIMIFKKTGLFISSSERSFLHAYRLCASRAGVTRSIEVSDHEMEPSSWCDVFDDLTEKWPIVVSRFTSD